MDNEVALEQRDDGTIEGRIYLSLESSNDLLSEVRRLVKTNEEIKTEMRALRAEVVQKNKEILSLKDEIQQLKYLINHQDDRYSSLIASAPIILDFTKKALECLSTGNWKECYELIEGKLNKSSAAYSQLQKTEDKNIIFQALRRGFVELVSVFLKNGFPADHVVCYDTRRAMMHQAASHGHLELVQVLLSHGADVNQRAAYNFTPLHYASYHGHVLIVQCLVQNGAEVDVTDDAGYTPLHWAAECGHSPVISTLIENGCDKSIANNAGENAYDLYVGGRVHSNIADSLKV